jgi:hypothetical protein
MERKLLLLVLVIFPHFIFAQFADDFSDGDFTQNPVWFGDTDKFIVEEQVLKLNDNQAGQAWLATSSSVIDDTQWEFWVRLTFTPSNNNHPRIYLVSDSDDLSGPLNGYYIRIGKDGTDNKRLYFYRQEGETSIELMEGATNIATTTNNRLRIKVTRDDVGNWEFWADPTGGELFVPQGNVADNEVSDTQYFGILCNYTVSNSSGFYFDDFYVGDIIVDTTVPEVTSLMVTDANTLELTFNKAVEPNTAHNVNNYFVNKGVGPPAIAIRPDETPNRVILIFAQSFTEKEEYTLSVLNIADYQGNVMVPFTGNFTWYVPKEYDVVFNEIMANPTPTVGLPAHEYIELYNTSDFPINLQGWTLQHGTTERQITEGMIPPKGYIVLTHPAALDALEEFGNVVAIPGLSTTALTNAGTLLVLYEKNGPMISWVRYSDTWYRDPSKADGGWALEKIDPYNFCQGAENWKAGTDPRGGTPGTPNSVLGNNPDTDAPYILRAGFADPNRIQIFFSESMDPEPLGNTGNYTIRNFAGEVTAAAVYFPDANKAELFLSQSMEPGVIYEVEASQSLTDCAGNPLAGNLARVGMPEPADSMDVVLNEILFNPPDRGVRYVEIYNRSPKIIDLKDYTLSSKDTITGVLNGIREITAESWLLFPDDYMVLTPDPAIVQSQYMTNNPLNFIPMTLSSMTNTSGIIVLASKGQKITDMFIYREDMHYVLLTDKKGVALERLNYHRPTQSRSNWHSAAQSAGFGTPGYKNSQFTMDPGGQQEVFEVYPRVFSPDNDGHDDLLNIAYAIETPGYTANISIFDSRGRRVRILSRSELLATEGVITWDGSTDDNQKADVGIYIIHIELFDPQGNVRNIRKTAVLAARF